MNSRSGIVLAIGTTFQFELGSEKLCLVGFEGPFVEEEASVKGYPIKGANFLTSGDLWKSMLKY
jgi:hypothetical protein